MSTMSIRPSSAFFVVRAAGLVIGETRSAQILAENDGADVIYFPRDSIGIEFLDKSATQSHCPVRGDATYYSLIGPEGQIEDIAVSYETPTNGAEAIAGHLAFVRGKATVEQL